MKAAALLFAAALGTGAQSYSAGHQVEFPVVGAEAPAVVRKAEPQYTPQARRAGIEGAVVLYVEVGTDGRARRIRVLKPLGYGLDRKAVDAMRRWRFLPGTRNGLPVATPATIEIRFRLSHGADGPIRV